MNWLSFSSTNLDKKCNFSSSSMLSPMLLSKTTWKTVVFFNRLVIENTGAVKCPSQDIALPEISAQPQKSPPSKTAKTSTFFWNNSQWALSLIADNRKSSTMFGKQLDLTSWDMDSFKTGEKQPNLPWICANENFIYPDMVWFFSFFSIFFSFFGCFKPRLTTLVQRRSQTSTGAALIFICMFHLWSLHAYL